MATLAVAGIAAPIVFTMLVIVQGLLQPDYSHVAMPISALAVWLCLGVSAEGPWRRRRRCFR